MAHRIRQLRTAAETAMVHMAIQEDGIVREKKCKKSTRANLAHFGARFGVASGLALCKAKQCRGGEHSSSDGRVCQAFLKSFLLFLTPSSSYHTLKLACLCVGRACSVHLLECWHLQHPGTRPERRKACFTGTSPNSARALTARHHVLRALGPPSAASGSSPPHIHLLINPNSNPPTNCDSDIFINRIIS